MADERLTDGEVGRSALLDRDPEDGGFDEDVDDLLVEEISIDGMCGVY